MKPPLGVARACVVLFGVEPARVPETLARLRPADLKVEFNRRALQVHPDRAATLGRDSRLLTEQFKLLRQAHDTLAHYLEGGQPSAPWGSAALPARPLPFGEFLYFTGWLPWAAIATALAAQQQQRRSWGATAVGLGLLGKVEVEQLELRRLERERLGDAAVRLGKLTGAQRDRVVATQRRSTPPLGECLLRLGLLLAHELGPLLAAHAAHNAACADPFSRWAA